MGQADNLDTDRAAKALPLVTEWADILFNYAPVMMNSIDENGVLLRVNRRWLAIMRYEPEEVLGQRSVDFLTEESRSRATTETLPLFWQAGRAHSIGYVFVRKNGRVINLLLDAVTIEHSTLGRVTLAALCDPDDYSKWQQGSTILKTLSVLDQTQRVLTNIPYVQGPEGPTQPQPNLQSLDDLLKSTQELAVDLLALSELGERKVHDELNQYQVLQLLAETIETTLPILSAYPDTPQAPG